VGDLWVWGSFCGVAVVGIFGVTSGSWGGLGRFDVWLRRAKWDEYLASERVVVFFEPNSRFGVGASPE
jgi:hypothetical protein